MWIYLSFHHDDSGSNSSTDRLGWRETLSHIRAMRRLGWRLTMMYRN